LLAHDARALKVIDELATRSNWGSPLPEGRARGCAYFECYGSLCAQVAEVSLEGGRPRVHRVVSVLDCGEVITPDGATAQVEGGIVQGLSAALGEAQTLKNGAAVELNFDRYQLLRAPDAPRVIETHFIASGESLGGVGEPPLPPIAPALTNAMRMLTGKPIRRLPLA
jgi:isoquinoline 1-oxidoreductase beta subunit